MALRKVKVSLHERIKINAMACSQRICCMGLPSVVFTLQGIVIKVILRMESFRAWGNIHGKVVLNFKDTLIATIFNKGV